MQLSPGACSFFLKVAPAGETFSSLQNCAIRKIQSLRGLILIENDDSKGVQPLREPADMKGVSPLGVGGGVSRYKRLPAIGLSGGPEPSFDTSTSSAQRSSGATLRHFDKLSATQLRNQPFPICIGTGCYKRGGAVPLWWQATTKLN
jgi:hypothetical protein